MGGGEQYEQSVMTVRWLTIDTAETGMMLARPVFATQKGMLSLTLAVGTVLTADMLLQLIAHSVECVGIAEDVAEDAEMKSLQINAHRQRLEEIFGASSEQVDAARIPLFNALLAARGQQ